MIAAGVAATSRQMVKTRDVITAYFKSACYGKIQLMLEGFFQSS